VSPRRPEDGSLVYFTRCLDFSCFDDDIYQATWRHPTVPPPPRFVRGDCNDDGEVNLSDACDTDADGSPCTRVTEGVRVLMYLFRGEAAPPPPFPECGTVEEEVSCATLPVNCQ
jgi:hypothetical protein